MAKIQKSKHHGESGTRFIRIRGRIVPIRSGTRVFERNKKTGERREVKQTKHITRGEASKFTSDLGAIGKRKAFRSKLGGSSLGGLGIATALLGGKFGGGKGSVAIGLGLTALGALGFREGVKHSQTARAFMDESKRIASGKGVGKAKTPLGAGVRRFTGILRRHIKDGTGA